MRLRRLRAVLAATSLLTLVACSPTRAVANASHTAGPPGGAGIAASPNIVFILTDDLAWNLLPYMPQVKELQHEGLTFDNFTVTDSLCCPSRSSIFTGEFPHDTGVFTNHPPDGGFSVFHALGDESQTYATALRAAGYSTAMMGKYLNGYTDTSFVPPGWSQWNGVGNGYRGYNYLINDDHAVVRYGDKPADYLTDVLAAKGTDFIRRSAAAHTPFALEIATFAPHKPYVPAPQDLTKFPGLRAPRTAAYDQLPSDPPSWLAHEPPLPTAEKGRIDAAFRKRAQSVQAVDRLIGSLRATLQQSGVADNTYFVFSSDNGLHMGEYRLHPGKQTAFDTDIEVPLIVVGPGVPAGATRPEVTQTIDLAPTFEQLAGVPVPTDVDGRSLVPLLHGRSAPDWRDAALIEHHGPNSMPGDPDAQTVLDGDPVTYEAIRTTTYTYVEYTDGEREYYDRRTDPNELHNVAGHLSATRLAALHTALQRLQTCHNAAACWTAGHVTA